MVYEQVNRFIIKLSSDNGKPDESPGRKAKGPSPKGKVASHRKASFFICSNIQLSNDKGKTGENRLRKAKGPSPKGKAASHRKESFLCARYWR